MDREPSTAGVMRGSGGRGQSTVAATWPFRAVFTVSAAVVPPPKVRKRPDMSIPLAPATYCKTGVVVMARPKLPKVTILRCITSLFLAPSKSTVGLSSTGLLSAGGSSAFVLHHRPDCSSTLAGLRTRAHGRSARTHSAPRREDDCNARCSMLSGG